jgi:hypothetical protein
VRLRGVKAAQDSTGADGGYAGCFDRRCATPMMAVPNDGRDPATYYGDLEASPTLWDPVYEYPVPLLVRNTFFEVMARSPSFDEFMEERKVKSSPAACEGEGVQPSAPPAAHRQPPNGPVAAAAGTNAQSGRNNTFSGYNPGAAPFHPPGQHWAPGGGESWNASAAEVYDYEQFAAGGSSVSFGRSQPRRPQTNSAALAATIAKQGYPGEARGAMAPPHMQPNVQHAGLQSAMPPWRNSPGQRGPGPRQHPSAHQAPSPAELPTPAPNSWSLGMFGDSGHYSRPSRPSGSGHMAAAVGDEPVLEESSSDDDDDGEPRINSEYAELGSSSCPTQGSRGHSMRMCKPCAFVVKGCQSGMDCKFCHLCEAGEKKRRKKEKVAIRRELQRWRHTSTPGRQTYSAPTTPANAAAGNFRIGNFW